MTKAQILSMIPDDHLAGIHGQVEFIETHISWVLLCESLVFKIKKPVSYSFLDFSSIEKRRFYCEREVMLNRRFSSDVYLGVTDIKETATSINIDLTGSANGDVIDYAVVMRRMDGRRQMNLLLANDQVSESDIKELASVVASFHRSASRIFDKGIEQLKADFNDLHSVFNFVNRYLGIEWANKIIKAIYVSDLFMAKSLQLLTQRLQNGYYRDCHGDLHSRNIFLLTKPQLFDCIEFNDDHRQIDVLNEVAFLCMDLDAMNRRDLSALFLKYYQGFLPMPNPDMEMLLFIYYKSYRANVRAKVNCLRALSAETDDERNIYLSEAKKYLQLLDAYLSDL